MSPRILYVDDDDANLIVFRAAFEDELDIVTAPSGAEALAWLARDPEIALLVTDQRMPGMSGTQLADIVRREHPDVVRYLITAYSDLGAAIDAINLGEVHRYLRKPWDAAELRVQLREGLELHSLRSRVRDLERRMRDVERVYGLGVVAASIVHELRNPLSVVLGYTDLARGAVERLTGAPPAVVEDLDRTLAGIAEAGTRMADVVRGVELTTRRHGGRAHADLADVVRLTLRLVGSDLKHRARLTCALAADVVVPVGPTPLSQVVLNLVLNALQAIPEGVPGDVAQVAIAAQRVGARARLAVADNGRGVPDALKAKIFDPFFTTKEAGGTGLGLAISREIVEEVGGALTVEDTPGGGATFVVDLPIITP